MSGECRDLWHCRAGDSEPHDGRPSEIVKRKVAMPARSESLPHDDPNPSAVHRRPIVLVRITGPRRSLRSSSAFSGVPAGITMRRPVFDCWNRICVPS